MAYNLPPTSSNTVNYSPDQIQQKARNIGRSCIVGVIAFVILTIAGGIGFGLWMEKLGNSFMFNMQAVPGDATKFDPVGMFGVVQAFAGPDYQPIQFEAKFVKADGTMDLMAAYEPSVEYRFAKAAQVDPASLPPVGAGKSAAEAAYIHTYIKVYQPGKREYDLRRVTYKNLGMRKTVNESSWSDPGLPEKFAPLPRCPFAELWRVAIAKGAPSDAVATILFDKDGYHFTIAETNVDLKFGEDCKLKP